MGAEVGLPFWRGLNPVGGDPYSLLEFCFHFSPRRPTTVPRVAPPLMITTRSFAVLGLCLAFGLAVFGVQVNRAVRRAREFDRYLTVRGASELEVKATLAIWPIRAAAFAEDLPGLKKAMEATRDIAVEFLRERGIPAEDINSGLPVVQDRHEIRTEDGHKISPRYKAVITLVVRSKKTDVVKQAIQQVDRLLARLTREAGFAGRIVVLGEPDIRPGDARIEWADGGIVIDRAALDRSIDDVIAEALGEIQTGAQPQQTTR